MPELTREEKLKLLEKLSPHLQELMTSENTGATLLYLGQKYHLSDHQVRLLSKILGDVVLGIIPVTNLSSEISTKVAIDRQTASGLAQDLDDLILSPKPMPVIPTPIMPFAPAPAPIPMPMRPLNDQYREPTTLPSQVSPREIWEGKAPEIVDLRKTPPISAPIITPKPIMPIPAPSTSPKPATQPLTFTRPIEPPKPTVPTVPVPPVYIGRPPLIEADPHKIPASAPKPVTPAPQPQYIMRPSGAPPTDLPENVLDLRKDKGEF